MFSVINSYVHSHWYHNYNKMHSLFQIHFMIVISANISHLKDHRLATMNAYSETTEEVRNSKHSVVDTTM